MRTCPNSGFSSASAFANAVIHTERPISLSLTTVHRSASDSMKYPLPPVAPLPVGDDESGRAVNARPCSELMVL